MVMFYLPSRDSALVCDCDRTCCSSLSPARWSGGGFVLGRPLSLICNAWAEFTPP